jgi:hypothetical protein
VASRVPPPARSLLRSRGAHAAFDGAVDEIAASADAFLDSLLTSAPPRDREIEAARARVRSAERFGRA